MNYAPVVAVLLFIWIIVILIAPVPVWVWWVMLAAVVSFYGPIVDAINWRIFRKERETEIAAQTAIIDEHLSQLEPFLGKKGAVRVVDLMQRRHWCGLTSAEAEELESWRIDLMRARATERLHQQKAAE